ncbi:MAG TPA: hypothetical protein VFN91_08700, partial [Myxococcaceae bacterium]|nr:hypothetical protein [Myxococcaceae bacterium]
MAASLPLRRPARQGSRRRAARPPTLQFVEGAPGSGARGNERIVCGRLASPRRHGEVLEALGRRDGPRPGGLFAHALRKGSTS